MNGWNSLDPKEHDTSFITLLMMKGRLVFRHDKFAPPMMKLLIGNIPSIWIHILARPMPGSRGGSGLLDAVNGNFSTANFVLAQGSAVIHFFLTPSVQPHANTSIL